MVAGINRDNQYLLPKRHSSTRLEEEFARKRVRQWANDLPIGDVQKIAQELNSKLDRLNRINISPLERFDVLGILHSPLQFVLDSLKHSCMASSMPLDATAKTAADLRLDIMVKLVISYKVVLSQFHDDSITGFILHRGTRAEALRNTIYFLGEILFHSYILYQPNLGYTWKELHGIYHYAVVNELVSSKRGIIHGKQDSLGIEELYKQIMLLALANPSSLLRGEADKVNNALRQWVANVELVSIKEPVWAKSFFLIDAQSDAMPCAPNLCSKEKLEVGWALVTDHLDLLLQEKIRAVQASHMFSKKMRPADAVSERLLEKLKLAWTQQIRSRAVRSHTSDLIDVICGLEPLYSLHGGLKLSKSLPASNPSNTFLSQANAGSTGQVVLERDEVLVQPEPQTFAKSEPDFGPRDKIQTDNCSKECITTNKSENGFYLSWPEDGEVGTHVGELVGLNPVSDRDRDMDINLGVIRWIHVERPGFLGMGVELLGGLTEPVVLQRKRKETNQVENMKGFLQHEGDGGISLITQPFYVDEDDKFRVVKRGERLPIELRHIIESTDSFVRFQFA